MGRTALAAFFALLAAAPLAAQTCLRPLAYDPPRTAIEVEQPHRLVADALTIPGYPWVVIDPTNRFPLHTIRDDRYEELVAGWPRSNRWEYRDVAVRPDGSVLGFSNGRTGLWVLRPPARDFVPVDLDQGRAFLSYEPHRDVVLIQTERRGLFEWDGTGVRTSPLGGVGYGQNMVLPRFLPGPNLWLASDGSRAFLRRDDAGADWQPIDTGGAGEGLWRLAEAPFHHDRGEGLLTLLVGERLLVYRIDGPGAPVLLHESGSASVLYGSTEGRALAVLRRPPVRPGWLARSLGAPDVPTRIEPLVVTAGGLVPVAEWPVAGTPAPGAHRLGSLQGPDPVRTVIRIHPPVFDLDDTAVFFDGRAMIAVPHLSEAAAGGAIRWFDFDGRTWALTGSGWHELMPDLSLRPVDWPVPDLPFTYHLDIAAGGGGLVVTLGTRPDSDRPAEMWVSADGEGFDPVRVGAVPVRRYISDIPGRSEGLVLADDGLHILDLTCAKAE